VEYLPLSRVQRARKLTRRDFFASLHSFPLLPFSSDINYVHQLVAAHLRSGDFTEAGLTLKLHASLYEWNRNSFVEPFVYGELELPRQSQFGRKESLYLQTLDYLGECFVSSRALSLDGEAS